jgi:hypothetical protein
VRTSDLAVGAAAGIMTKVASAAGERRDDVTLLFFFAFFAPSREQLPDLLGR